MSISIIAAVAENNIIGRDNGLPWQLSSDLKYFARTTKGKPVLMGLKTYQSIFDKLGHPLPGRQNIVLAEAGTKIDENCILVSSWDEAMKQTVDKDVFVIGGRSIYQQALPYADKLYLTRVHASPTGDTDFPAYDETKWNLTSSTFHPKEEGDEYDCTFNIYEKIENKDFVNLSNARTEEQTILMTRIKEDGVCPFCSEHLKKYHPKPIIKETEHWFATENMSPYEGTKFHFIFIAKRHFTMPLEMTKAELENWHDLVNWLVSEKQIKGGSILVRFGDTHYTGGSVDHYHTHLIVGDVDSPNHQAVKVKVG